MNDPMLAPLDRLRSPDLTHEVGRRLRQPSRPIPVAPRTSRRIAAAWSPSRCSARPPASRGRCSPAARSRFPAADPWAWAGEGWTELPPPPEFRDGAAVVWTGTELMYWGGLTRDGSETLRDDGWMFDPTTQQWRAIPPAPVALARGHGVWTGREAIVWGETAPLQETQVPKSDFGTVLAYDPTAATWRELRPPPTFLPTAERGHGPAASSWSSAAAIGRMIRAPSLARPWIPSPARGDPSRRRRSR